MQNKNPIGFSDAKKWTSTHNSHLIQKFTLMSLWLKYEPETIKVQEENRGKSLWLQVRQRFLRWDTKSVIHERKTIDQLNFIKIKNCLPFKRQKIHKGYLEK